MPALHQWLDFLPEISHLFDEIIKAQHDALHARHCRNFIQHARAGGRTAHNHAHHRRLFAAVLGDALGASVVVENRADASGTIGADVVAKAAPYGLTLAVSHAIPFGFAPGVLPFVAYDPVVDFSHIAMLAEAPTISVVRANSPFANMQAVITAARSRPVRFATSGVGSAKHFSGALLTRAAEAAKLYRVPYRGTAPALQDLLAGQIDKLNAPITTLVGQLRDGSLRKLVTSSEARVSGFPDVPTLAERGARLAATIAQLRVLTRCSQGLLNSLPCRAAQHLRVLTSPALSHHSVIIGSPWRAPKALWPADIA
jgi:tripartite-type tricarboxylate transporter receptor subunit TctC